MSLRQNIGPIDVVVFSGDLVFAGTSEQEFAEAYQETLLRLVGAAGLTEERLLIAPGNHDVCRQTALSDQELHENGLIATLNSRDRLNDFIDRMRNPKVDITPLLRLMPYYRFMASLRTLSRLYIDPFLEVHKFEIEGLTYGFALFNSAWRSTGAGEEERKKMMLGEASVVKAVELMDSFDVKIAVVHHPFEWLAEFDRVVVEPQIISAFDVILHGHIHSSSPEHRVSVLGNVLFSQCGCLYQSPSYHNSFQVVGLSPNTSIADIVVREWYDLPRGQFDKAMRLNSDGALRSKFEPRAISRLSLTQRLSTASRPGVYRRADDHITLRGEGRDSFMNVFVCPPLEDAGKNAPDRTADRARLEDDDVSEEGPDSKS